MSGKLSQRQFEKQIAQLTQEELVAELSKLFKKFKDVQHYYQMELGEKDGRNVVLDEYKKSVKSQFYAASGNPKNPKASQLRRILSDFKNMAVFQTDLVSLILYRVECAVDFTNDVGDIDSVFYESAANAFAQATKIIEAEKLQAQFAERCEDIVVQSSGIGWGFHDDLKEIHYECFGTRPKSLGYREGKKRLVG
ncbi:MAG: hypothetical protein IT258_14665 [Saprospiraceae bacterium]|nr:hypothetical protein [Saprospiraceae bacterium]